jgi:hypothetical protein
MMDDRTGANTSVYIHLYIYVTMWAIYERVIYQGTGCDIRRNDVRIQVVDIRG